MNLTRRNFIVGAGLGAAGLAMPSARSALAAGSANHDGYRICFFTDSHLPYADTLARLPESKFHHQKRIRAAFDHANRFSPDAFIFGGDNVFAVDQSDDGGDKEDNARDQFNNWKNVVTEKVKVPHHSVIGNHDIWYARPKGQDPKSLAIAAYGMPSRYYSFKMGGWKFVMLDVFGITGAPVDSEQLTWLQNELADDLPICIVTHAPILSVTAQLIGGSVGSPKVFRELFLKHPNVRLALSGHNHMLDDCTMDHVTYICGGAVSGAWWGGDYEHCPPAFVIIDMLPNGSANRQIVYYENKL